MNPRTVCFCQPIFSMISASVAPFFRRRSSITRLFLLSGRGSAAGLGAFLPAAGFVALVAFLGAASAAFLAGAAFLAAFWLLGALFFWLAAFFEGASSGATGAPCS